MLNVKARLPQVGEEIQISLKSEACRMKCKEIGDYKCKVLSSSPEQVILLGADNILKEYSHMSAENINFDITAEFAFKRFELIELVGIPSIQALLGGRDDLYYHASDNIDNYKILPLADITLNKAENELLNTGFDYWLMDNASYDEAYYVDSFGHISVTSVHERMTVVPLIKIDLDAGEPIWDQDIFDWFDTIDLLPILKDNSGSDISRVMQIIQEKYAGIFYKDTGLEAQDYMWYCLLTKNNTDNYRFAKYLAKRYAAVDTEAYESFRILTRR